jgi:hypothetical protein
VHLEGATRTDPRAKTGDGTDFSIWSELPSFPKRQSWLALVAHSTLSHQDHDMDHSEEHPIYHVMIEPFHGGSHKQLINGLFATDIFPSQNTLLLTLPAKKWKWYEIDNPMEIQETLIWN